LASAFQPACINAAPITRRKAVELTATAYGLRGGRTSGAGDYSAPTGSITLP
jgi:hypothetical protein